MSNTLENKSLYRIPLGSFGRPDIWEFVDWLFLYWIFEIRNKTILGSNLLVPNKKS